jgi:YebC/PmpR family DNA-binding regulatory protein
MAGHSKWANIKHRKGKQDAKRGKVFTKLIKEITVAARMGGGDADSNPRLRLAVDKALSANMTKDTITRAVKRGAGDQNGAEMFEMVYEGYATNGVAVVVECLTDNKNRTVADVRHAFSKFGGNLGTDGSVSYMFEKIGVISLQPGYEEDAVFEAALNAGAEEVILEDDGSMIVQTTPEDLLKVKQALEAANFVVTDASATRMADLRVPLDEEQAEKLDRMLDMLEDNDDVQDVYTNADYPEG